MRLTFAVLFPVVLFALSCAPPVPDDPSGAPFAGSVKAPAPAPDRPIEKRNPPPRAPAEAVRPPDVPVAVNEPMSSLSAAEQRKNRWLHEPFRCRAISTVRMRPCRFEQTKEGISLSFMGDIRCADVRFDDNGDPAELLDCRCNWLRIPSDNRLTKAKNQNIWSGSHAGWWWKSDGEPYCCPGMWIEGPADSDD